MYEAKQRGRNNYQFFRNEMQRTTGRTTIAGRGFALRAGAERVFAALPAEIQSSDRTDHGDGSADPLATPATGNVSPGQFVPIAEECGLILPIGQWVLLEACKQARAWSDAGLGVVPVSVNVSAAEFGAKDFLSGVRAVLIATGVEPQNLELELTESVLMEDAESAVRTLCCAESYGRAVGHRRLWHGVFQLYLSAAFSSGRTKVDQSFVQEITADPGDATIVSAMINIGKSLNQRVIAEGVETRAQLEFLRRHG